MMLLVFIAEYPVDVQGFDETASWPSIFDEFYEALTEGQSESTEDFEKYLVL